MLRFTCGRNFNVPGIAVIVKEAGSLVVDSGLDGRVYESWQFHPTVTEAVGED
jgi:hypothetical protein